MAPAFDLAAFERATDSLLDILSVEIAQALVAYRGDDKLRAKIDELAGKNTEGLLTDKDALNTKATCGPITLCPFSRLKLASDCASPRRMNEATRNLVRRRAGNRCEYCGRPQSESLLASLHIEHILPRKHHGGDDAENLALACIDCNLHKGTNVAGYDPVTGALTGLFHPRRQLWSDHFEWHGVLIVGITAVGRTTVDVLELNSPDRLELRAQSNML